MLPLRLKISFCFLLCLTAGILTCPPVSAGQISGVTVDAANHQGRYVPDNMVDGDPATAWVGGGKGIGPGKWIELSFEKPVTLDSLHVANGNQGRGQFKKFRRMIRGVVIYPDETRQKFTLRPDAGVQRVKLLPKTVDSFKIIITGVAPSSRDKSIGRAKVSVSELAVYGEVAEGDAAENAESAEGEAVAPVVVEKAAPKAAPVPESAPAPKPVPVVEKKTEPKPVPKPVAKPLPKSKPAPKAEPKPQPKPVSKAKAKPKPASKPKPKAKSKPVAKKRVSKKKKAARPVSSVPKGSMTFLRKAAPVSATAPLDVGVINPWLDLEFVAGVKRYFALLTTLHDSYPDVFVSAVRERERRVFVDLQEDMRAKRQFGEHHIAMLEHIGLNFDKPLERDDRVVVWVHGPYRYYVENTGYEIAVDTTFTFVREGGVWLIEAVHDN